VLARWTLLGALACGCAAPPCPTVRTSPRESAPVDPALDVARARAEGKQRLFAWLPYEAASFERARRENKPILLDGAAEWCHYCHVMDATTYADPEVGALLRDRFITIRVDVDAHPDVAERYGDWGWPATILLSPDGSELGKLRGYLPKAELLAALRSLGSAKLDGARPSAAASRPATPAELPWVVAWTLAELDDYYDEDLGGWGRRQKAPLGENLEIEARRASRLTSPDATSRQRVAQTVAAQRALIDPVWGGIYQYSEEGAWDRPHYEKLMTYQAANLAAYAEVWRATADPRAKADGAAIVRYMSNHLGDPTTASFFVSQDADVHAHSDGPFVDGRAYYPLDDAARRALGVPRVDRNVYPLESGLAIRSMALFGAATGDSDATSLAVRAADAAIERFVDPDGSVARRGDRVRAVRFLADAASLGHALVTLYDLQGQRRFLEAALRIADALERDFGSTPAGAYFAATVDSEAVGVFAERRVPFEPNVSAVRLLTALARHEPTRRARAESLFAAISMPAALSKQGRMLGGYLLAADDLGLLTPVEAAPTNPSEGLPWAAR
jgi:uncharacterized protein YyaL (SSP411 family)